MDNHRIDKSAFSVVDLAKADEIDKEYWRKQTRDQRMLALEINRHNYIRR